MKKIVTGKEMKLLDDTTSQKFKVPSVVLMEQAAMGVVRELVASFPCTTNFLVVCGKGNNAGDGIAVARILNQMNYKAAVYFCSDSDEGASELFLLQREIYMNYKFPVESCMDESRYDVIVDAIFGTGLSRDVTGKYLQDIVKINLSRAKKIAIDIASGVNADDGRVMGNAVNADITYTFSYEKVGQILWPGSEKSGKVVKVPIGITDASFIEMEPCLVALEETDLSGMPDRPQHSNKGTYGRLLIIAGSINMAGAAVLCAKAAYRCGCGLVKVITVPENRTIIQSQVPEALLGTYEDIDKSLEWADAVVIGPGIGKEFNAQKAVYDVIAKVNVPLLIDADALNIISDDTQILKQYRKDIIVTPHLGEMSRLIDKPVTEIQSELIDTAKEFSYEYNVVCVLKDFRTIVADSNAPVYINQSGNSGMATAGSGDVLSGVIGAFLASGMELQKAAAYGVFIHGLAGDRVFIKTGSCGMMASDIINGLNEIWNKVD